MGCEGRCWRCRKSVLGSTGAGWRDPWVLQGAIFVNETGSEKTGYRGGGHVCDNVRESQSVQSVMDWTFLSLWLEFYWLRNYFPPDVWRDKWTGGMESQCILTCETAHDKVCGIFPVTGSWFLERKKKKAFLSSSVPHMQLPQIDRSSSTDSPSSRSPRTMVESVESSVQPHTGWWVNGKLTSPCSSTPSTALRRESFVCVLLEGKNQDCSEISVNGRRSCCGRIANEWSEIWKIEDFFFFFTLYTAHSSKSAVSRMRLVVTEFISF